MSNMGVFGKTIRIRNDIKGNLEVHCKSKDNDLGSITLPPKGEWGFTFQPNIWRTTLFFCDLWSDTSLTTTTLVVYDDKVKGYLCE
ncbi:hypothetical protein MLD38_018337 [Melastoma candidum]|uniref:Uncharacterized protein n=1 Tax=Melastoma candidum TaxID=119954 RepID=A0ACB9QSM5_9MYRT|nr:hypothetical protein MLD38_018337 [Melastoma candidum]